MEENKLVAAITMNEQELPSQVSVENNNPSALVQLQRCLLVAGMGPMPMYDPYYPRLNNDNNARSVDQDNFSCEFSMSSLICRFTPLWSSAEPAPPENNQHQPLSLQLQPQLQLQPPQQPALLPRPGGRG